MVKDFNTMGFRINGATLVNGTINIGEEDDVVAYVTYTSDVDIDDVTHYYKPDSAAYGTSGGLFSGYNFQVRKINEFGPGRVVVDFMNTTGTYIGQAGNQFKFRVKMTDGDGVTFLKKGDYFELASARSLEAVEYAGPTTSSSGSGGTFDDPVIGSISVSAALVGAEIVIYGSNFENATAVKFGTSNTGTGGTPAITYTVNGNGTQITVTVPAGSASGRITVITPLGQVVSSTNFNITPPVPTITSFSPSGGSIGAVIDIIGTGFTTGSSVRFFNNISTSVTYVNSTLLRSPVPVGATDGVIKVITAGGTATSAGSFDVA